MNGQHHPADLPQSSLVEPIEGAVPTTIELGGVSIEVQEIGVAYARAEIPSLIRESNQAGKVFRIRNAKNPSAPSAILVSPETLERLLLKPARRRTLGEVLDLLPFNTVQVPRLRAGLPNNSKRALRAPSLSDSAKGLLDSVDQGDK